MMSIRQTEEPVRPQIGSWGRRAVVLWNVQGPGDFPVDTVHLRARIESGGSGGVSVQFCGKDGVPFLERWYPNTSICFVEWLESHSDAVHAHCEAADRDPSVEPSGSPDFYFS